jgi:hypothetical protein
MDHRQILQEVARTISERGERYDTGSENSFPRAAAIASFKLDREVSAYEVAIILESVKDARRATDPGHPDNHVDGIAYRAFAAEFAKDYVDHLNVDRVRKVADDVSQT